MKVSTVLSLLENEGPIQENLDLVGINEGYFWSLTASKVIKEIFGLNQI